MKAETFDAFVLPQRRRAGFRAGVEQLRFDDLPAGGNDRARVRLLSVNYKDGLACLPESQW
ncbi:hypothetical protein HBB16_11750 [Pseudonocardia sp. MCCB 268]|nr:hypothetical protein [Pseudonocardia cytotoxica]